MLQLIDDINLLEGADTHLFGSVVCLTGAHTAGVNSLELVDGQQRLTSINILLELLRETFKAAGADRQIQELARLLSAQPYNGPPMPKIALDTMDSEEFRLHADGKDAPMAATFANRQLEEAFRAARGWIADQTEDHLIGFQYRLLNQGLVVRLDVSEAKDAFKLFETINNRGLKLSSTDLIKNLILGNAARFGSDKLEQAKAGWTKLTRFLDTDDSDAFFRYLLISRLQKRVTKADVVSEFHAHFLREVSEAAKLPERYWYDDELEDEDESDDATVENGNDDEIEADPESNQVSFVEFLNELVTAAKIYSELVNQKTGDKAIDRHLRNLHMIKAVQTYGFLMHLRAKGASKRTFIEVLRLTEDFILRRHICRERANETETMFANLCDVDPKNPLPRISETYRDASPSDDKFRDEFANASFTSNIIDRARYCLEQLELSKHGKHEELGILGTDAVHVEHIIPQRITTRKSREEFGNWEEYLGDRVKTLHPKFVHRIGNLTLFAGSLNIVASNNPFSMKKKNYKESSILMTKELAEMANFKFTNIDARSKELAQLAVERWPIP